MSGQTGSVTDVGQSTRLRDIADRVLDAVGDRAEAQVTVTAHKLGLTRFANSAIHQHVGETTTTIALELAVDARVASLTSTRVDDTAVDDLVERALDVAEVRPADPHWPGVTTPEEVPDVVHYDPPTAAADPEERAGYVKDFVEAAPQLQAAGFCDTDAAHVVVATTAGHRAAGRSTRATLDGIHQTATSAGKAHQTALDLASLDGQTAGATAARLARDSAAADDLEPGRYEVVLAPECVGTILAFLAFYGFNAKQHLEGQSFARIGEVQFDPAIEVVDDATDARALGLAFDAEGSPKRPVALIDAGTTSSLTHDRRTAARAETQTTGHAIEGGTSYGAIATNMFMTPGDTTTDDLVAEVGRGLIVTEFNYCRVLDPKSQVVTGLTRNGTFLVEDGEIVRPVTNLRFTQSFVEGLEPGNVAAVGSDPRFADTEFGAGMVHAPAVRLRSWNFTGGAQG